MTDYISRQAAIEVVSGIDRDFVKYITQIAPAAGIIKVGKNKKTYKLNSGENLVFHYNDNRIGIITVEAMDAIIDRLNNSVDVVRCRECKFLYLDENDDIWKCPWTIPSGADGYCSYGERADT